ncbi:MAG: tetratricopeptide repeat protein, partial [Acidobacteria bacterium]|nr:tetratricopeptide repeat protein [Acidobacteriota bacterium]
MSELGKSARITVGRLALASLVTIASSSLVAQASAPVSPEATPQGIPGEQAKDENAAMHLRLGAALRELGRADEAIGEFRLALELAPEDAMTHHSLGSVLAEGEEYAEAIVHLEKARALAPENPLISYELGEALRRAERFEQALVHFAAAIELDPPAENARLGQAEALVNLGQFRQASQRLEEAKVLLPESRSVDFALAWLLASCPDPELRDGARALELANSVFAARRSLGAVEILASAQAESGSCAEAAETQEFVVEQATGFSLSPEIMARLERSLERFEGGAPCG